MLVRIFYFFIPKLFAMQAAALSAFFSVFPVSATRCSVTVLFSLPPSTGSFFMAHNVIVYA